MLKRVEMIGGGPCDGEIKEIHEEDDEILHTIQLIEYDSDPVLCHTYRRINLEQFEYEKPTTE